MSEIERIMVKLSTAIAAVKILTVLAARHMDETHAYNQQIQATMQAPHKI